jgi:predicted acetylornithine/succinylornithine family transaminase
MTTAEIIEAERQVVLGTYARPKFVLTHGEGVHVFDKDGKRYLDFVAGIAVNGLGYADPGAVRTLQEQAVNLWHCSNLYYTEPQVRLAQLLVEQTFADKVFFANSGTEAVEGAIKLARKWGRETKGRDAFEIVAFENSFHGRSLGALSATGQPKFRADFEPMLPGFSYAVFNDLASTAALISPRTCAVIVEPVQGEGGVYPAEVEFLQGVRRLCDERRCLLILDEIQCGLGRTGTLCAYEQYGLRPDMMVIAKPLAAGLPMGAILMTDEIAGHVKVGNHGSTFGGGPLIASVAEYVVRKISQPDFLRRVRESGDYLRGQLEKLRPVCPEITAVRSRGLMFGVELSMAAQPVIASCAELGLLVCKAGDTTLRLVPPLIVERPHIDEALRIVKLAFQKVRDSHVEKS